MINYILCPPTSGSQDEGSRTPPLYSLLVWITVFLCHGSSDEVCPLHSWLCGVRSFLRDALERFTQTTTARPCGARPGMYPPRTCCTSSLRVSTPALASVICSAPAVACIPLVLPCLGSPQTVRRSIHLCMSAESHGNAMCVIRLRRCWRLGASNHP